MIKREPDFQNILNILQRKKADRPTLFEFIIDVEVLKKFASDDVQRDRTELSYFKTFISGFNNAGYDYAFIPSWDANLMDFPKAESHSKASKSQNEGWLINSWEDFEQYQWPDPEVGNYELFEKLKKHVPDGMRLLTGSNCGVLENATEIVGFENLCFMYLMDPELTKAIFDAIGSRLVRYFEIVSQFDSIGFMMGNDDWGFKTQTMFPPDMLREYVIPWHKRIIEAVHANNKPIIMHSCGNLKEVMEDVIDIGYDGKHSFEDGIYKVEDAWDWWSDRIAIMGGIDVDYLVNATPVEIENRVKNLIRQTENKAYAVGSGNSIPYYIPFEKYLAMIKVVNG